jgi:putative Mn2+ efflux pump MntP
MLFPAGEWQGEALITRVAGKVCPLVSHREGRGRVLWKFAALITPLGLDTFAVAAALAIAGLPKESRLRVSVLFTVFEAGMPVGGLLIGAIIGQAIGQVASDIAIATLILLGLSMLWPRNEEAEEECIALLGRTHGLAVLGLGLSISLDELALGFTAGLLHLPVLTVVVWIAVQAFALAQLGMHFGSHIGESVREGAEHLAGLILAALGRFLLIETFVNRG